MNNGYSSFKGSLAGGYGIPHYYGDSVRLVLILMAVLSFVVTPLWGGLLPFNVILQVAASLLLVLLAGFTTAKSQIVMLLNATVCGVSVVLLEYFAVVLQGIGPDAMELFISREIGVLLMIAGLYWSIKTYRAMTSGKIGRPDSPLEFVDDISMSEADLVTPEEPEDPRATYDG